MARPFQTSAHRGTGPKRAGPVAGQIRSGLGAFFLVVQHGSDFRIGHVRLVVVVETGIDDLGQLLAL